MSGGTSAAPSIAGSVAAFAACAALGVYVTTRPPTQIDVGAGRLHGGVTPLAVFFSTLGRWRALLLLAAAAYAGARAYGADAGAVVVMFVSQVLGQSANMAVKLVFRRIRPDRWLVRQERDLSYPSGHAATAIVFFAVLGWLALTGAGPLPARGVLVIGCAACVFGIPWSRLALGAHYATDVIGGLLFGTGWVCATAAVVRAFGR